MGKVSCLLGTVTQMQGPEYTVVPLDNSSPIQCTLVGKRISRGRPVVGDRVQFNKIEERRGLISGLEKRQTELVRAGFRRRPKILVANIDRLMIVASAQQPPLRAGLLDRYIVAAEDQGMVPVLCFNKWELATPEDEKIAEVYANLGYPFIKLSAARGEGISDLRAELAGHQSAFVGHSGVGKSSLMRLLFPEHDFEVGGVNERTGRGRHTTTHARLLSLPEGGFVVDTPGIREFGLLRIKSTDLEKFYVEFLAPSSECRFKPCSHSHEPVCGVKEAVSKSITSLRYQGYLRLFQELSEEEAGQY